MRCFINKIIIILVILGSYAGSCCAEAFPVLYKVEGIVEMNDIDPYGWGGRPFALEMRIMSDAEPDYANEYGDFSRTQYIPTVSSFIVDNASQSFDDSLIEFRKIHPYHLGELNDDVRIELHDVGQNGDVLIVTKELPFCSLGQFPVSPVQSINGGGGGAVWDNSMVEHTYKLNVTLFEIHPECTIIDNEDPGFSSGPSAWKSSRYIPGGYNSSYLYAPPGDGSMWAEWEYTGESSGFFEVSARWTAYGNRSTEAPYTINIHYAAGYSSSDTVTVDQTANGGQFISLGNYSLGPGDVVTVLLSNTTTGYVIADAIKMGYRSKYWIPAQTEDNTDSEFTTGGNWGTSSVIPGYYGTNYMYATPDGGDKWAKWTFIIEEPLDYEINAQWTEFENRSPTADYSIMNNGIEIGEVTVDQTQNGGRLNNLGTFYLESGSLEVVLNKSPEGCVIADAVQIVPR